MRTTPTRTAVCLAISALPLFLACKSKPVQTSAPTAPAPVSRNFTGLWEGRDNNGAACTVRFIDARWESYMDKGGARTPYYRGTYTFTGSSLDLRVLEEGDPVTAEWVPERGSFPRNISGRLAGGRLKIPALIETELLKK